MSAMYLVITILGLAASPSGPEFADMAPRGVLVVSGAGAVPDLAVRELISTAKGEKGHLVVIQGSANGFSAPWKGLSETTLPKISILQARNRSEAERPEFSEVINKATGVWFADGSSGEMAAIYAGTPLAERLSALLGRGGVVGGAPGNILGSAIITDTNEKHEPKAGLGLLPGVIISPELKREKFEQLISKAAARIQGQSGLVIDDQTALIARGRQIQVLGKGSAHWVSFNSEKPRITTLPTGTRDDLVRLHRFGGNRPPVPRGKPTLDSGSVMAVGGGGMGPELAKRFIQLAGGEGTNIVILPTAAPETSPTAQGEQAIKLLSRGGTAKFKVLASTKRQEVESEDYLASLEKAGGVWFGGGRQWRFVDAYEGTRFKQALDGVLKRGGVIGGSSAGATILGDYLCRGGPLGNTEIMVPGYDLGFAFLKGVGIDQHFAQRKRFSDMEKFSSTYPNFIGVGIDEATALIVTAKGAEALGPGKVHVYKNGKALSSHASGERVNLSP